MPLQQLRFRPGIDRDQTNLAVEGAWWDCNNVRFWKGLPQKLGGWVRAVSTPLAGIARAIITWNAFSPNNELIGVGTNERYYIATGGGVYDITPIAVTPTVGADPIATTTGSNTLTFTVASHGLASGQHTIISGATGVGGVPASEINGIHAVRVVDTNTFRIRVTTPATSTATGGGAAVVVQGLVYAGPALALYSGGWGTGPWGSGGWGAEPTSQVLVAQPGIWPHDTFGNDLFLNPRGGAIYYWAYSSGAGLNNRAVELSTLATVDEQPWVPNEVNTVLTSDLYNFLLAYGVNPDNTSAPLDPLFVRWSDQNNVFDWEPKITNQAGGIRLSSGSTIMTARKVRQETLIWTDTALYVQQYIGPPLVFNFQLVSDNLSMISPNGVAVLNGVAYWMGAGQFYRYDGAVQALDCPVANHVFRDFNASQAFQVSCGYNERYGEIIWHYPSTASGVPDRYVIYNARENVWYIGAMPRTAWRYSPIRQLPLAAMPVATTDVWGDPDYTTTLLLHEVGNDDVSTGTPQPISAYIETADFDIAEGHKFAFVSKLIPDVRFDGSNAIQPRMYIGVDVRREPGTDYVGEPSEPVVRSATLPVEQYTAQLHLRARGRQMKLRVSSTDLGVAWRFGVPRLDIREDGRR
jgi:hypothetical protein